MPEPLERTAIYRLYNADNQLLYVGISRDPDARWKAHRYEEPKAWCALVASRSLEWLDSREDALAAEATAIKSERPRFNGTHNYAQAEFDPSRWPRITVSRKKYTPLAGLIREEIDSGRWLPGNRLPTLGEMAEATGISIRTASKALVVLQGEGLLSLQQGRGVFVTPVRPAPS